MFWIYAGFILFVVSMLALDLGVFHKKAHVVGIRESLIWSLVWIALGVTFSVFVYFGYENQWLGLGTHVDAISGTVNDGRHALIKYLTGYVIEKSLSVDNIFVIAMIFTAFAVPALYQHRVLYWGILGALVMRGAMIAVGVEVITRYHWVLYVFGVFLIITAVKMVFISEDKDVRESAVVKFLTRLLPVKKEICGARFVVRDAGRILLTPLGMTLIVVEVSDLIFAVDSIPAIFAITADPFLVFTSNVFAILGLRSLFFALAGMIELFRYLKPALALILALVGFKMIFAKFLAQLLGPNMSLWVLGAIIGILALAVTASVVTKETAQKS